MPNSLMIVFSASEFDEMDEVCSIWQNCDCVSYKKFVVKYPSLKHCCSFLENVSPNQMKDSLLNQIFDEYLATETKKVKI